MPRKEIGEETATPSLSIRLEFARTTSPASRCRGLEEGIANGSGELPSPFKSKTFCTCIVLAFGLHQNCGRAHSHVATTVTKTCQNLPKPVDTAQVVMNNY